MLFKSLYQEPLEITAEEDEKKKVEEDTHLPPHFRLGNNLWQHMKTNPVLL